MEDPAIDSVLDDIFNRPAPRRLTIYERYAPDLSERSGISNKLWSLWRFRKSLFRHAAFHASRGYLFSHRRDQETGYWWDWSVCMWRKGRR